MNPQTLEHPQLLELSAVSRQEGASLTLDGVNLQLQANKKLAIAGETGSGKTTLLKIMAGLVAPTAGEVRFEGVRVKGPDERLIPGQPGIAYLSQQFEFPNHYRVEEILDFENRLPQQQAEELYKVCRIDHLMKRMNGQVSGGERQRIALARLLISSPRLLLLDEPFSNLDAIHRSILKSVIRDLGEQLNITCLLVSHDPLDTLSWADEVIVLKEGKIVQQGRPEVIYQQPVDAYVAGLFGVGNFIGPQRASVFAALPGMEMKDRTAFIRPENFTLTEESPDAIAGIISGIHFFGSYNDLDIIVNDGSVITVRITDAHKKNKNGDAVFVSLTRSIWWLGQSR